MAVAEVKGLPRYVKVIDASIQDSHPHIDFTDGQGRIGKAAVTKHAVTADNYTAVKQTQNEEAKQALTDENAILRARIAELEAAQQSAESVKVEIPPVVPPSGDDKKKPKSGK